MNVSFYATSDVALQNKSLEQTLVKVSSAFSQNQRQQYASTLSQVMAKGQQVECLDPVLVEAAMNRNG